MALAAEPLLPASGRVLDLGSGGGVPGLPLAVAGADRTWVLLDGSVKRTEFLRFAVTELGLEHRVAVVTTRAELAGHDPALRATFDAVIARSFAAPAVTAECGAPFLRVGGRLIVAEPPEPGADRWPAQGLAPLGLAPTREPSPALAASYRVLTQAQTCPPRFPRRVGIPSKRPLF